MLRPHRVRSALTVGFAVLSVMLGEELNAQSSTTNLYRASFGWENFPEGRGMGTVSGVFPDPDGQRLWILDRCGGNQCAGTDLDPISKFDLDGNLVDSFGAGLFAFPHGFLLDQEGFLWVTEGGSHGDIPNRTARMHRFIPSSKPTPRGRPHQTTSQQQRCRRFCRVYN